ncbi:MAG TPA: ribosome maturation factor RimP [Longimicrobiales bacterium]
MAEVLEEQIESRIAAAGFELVELERAGSKTRPILRLRIERPDAAPGQSGVTLEDCTRVSRAVEAFLDERGDLSERYVLEVSSPGLERPLVRRRDYERFAGQEVSLKTSEALPDHGKRIEGVLRGISADDVVTVLVNEQPVEIRLGNIKKAHLVFRWEKERR